MLQILPLRKPQLRLAEIAVDALSDAGLERADWLCLVRSLEHRLCCSAGTTGDWSSGRWISVATLQGTEQYQVRISVPTRELVHMLIPGIEILRWDLR